MYAAILADIPIAVKILVTGGAGFIGSHVARALLADGHTVHVLDDLSHGQRSHVPAAAVFHQLDLRDAEVRALWQRERYSVLVHHAAQIDVRRSAEAPAADADVNIQGFLHMMEAGRAQGLTKVLFASTGGALYGEPEYTPQDEAHPIRPLSPYGIAKHTAEQYLDFYRRTHGIAYVALRYANVYGPRQNAQGAAGVIATFAHHALTGIPATIYGDGTQTRDYVYVGDVVDANRLALAYPDSGVFNIGTGVETSVNQLHTVLADVSPGSIPPRYAPARRGEQYRSVLSYAHAQQRLGWQPRTTLRDGLQATVAWYAAQLAEETA
ncbi:MAG: NAD-dependent epimerase/dehydratase family protein [Bacteroidota bacterium]